MNSIINDDIDLLIAQLVNGDISREDFTRLTAWTRESVEHRDAARRQLGALLAAQAAHDNADFDVDAAINRFLSRVGLSEGHADRISELSASSSSQMQLDADDDSRRIRFPRLYLRWVAAAAILVGVLFGAYYMGGRSVESHFSDIIADVPVGTQIDLTLPDGTKVKLNSASRLSYSQGFGITDRHVRLDGEGYFNVKHDEKMPFIVHVGNTDVTDLGTEFLIRNYDIDSCLAVEVYKGKARVDTRDARQLSIDAHAGDRVTLNKHTGLMNKTALSDDDASARQLSELTFEGATLAYIANVLSRAYGVKVEADKSVADKSFFCTFNRHADTLESVLEDMSKTRNIRYRRVGGGYLLY